MNHGALSDRIRNYALSHYILPAKRRGDTHISIAVRDLMKELEARNFPAEHQAQFCTAMKTKPFLRDNGLVLERIDGPPSKKSTTVVFHYRIHDVENPPPPEGFQARIGASDVTESSAGRAFRLTEKLRGLMKHEIASFGGADAFMRWVRSDVEDEA